MTPPRRVARISHRDQLLKNKASLDWYAALAGKPPVELAIDIPPAPQKRAPAMPSGVPLERDVQKEIVDGLRSHPLIGMVERVNSGTALEQNLDGSKRYIEFHRVYPVAGIHFAAVDIHCTLRSGGRRFVIECKRPGWKEPRGKRELAQAAYINQIILCGGFGMFATSWKQVEYELKTIAEELAAEPKIYG